MVNYKRNKGYLKFIKGRSGIVGDNQRGSTSNSVIYSRNNQPDIKPVTGGMN